MPTPSSLRDLRNIARAPTTAGREDCQDAVHSHFQKVAANSSAFPRRFDRVIGLTIGGILFGTGGCFLGASMPYRDPVGIAISMLWWAIYFGCFGVWLGAVLGASVERIRVWLSQKSRAKAEKLETARPTGVTTTPSKSMWPVSASQFKTERDSIPISTQSLAEGASRSGGCRENFDPAVPGDERECVGRGNQSASRLGVREN